MKWEDFRTEKVMYKRDFEVYCTGSIQLIDSIDESRMKVSIRSVKHPDYQPPVSHWGIRTVPDRVLKFDFSASEGWDRIVIFKGRVVEYELCNPYKILEQSRLDTEKSPFENSPRLPVVFVEVTSF